ncbi:MAG: NUDIX hydrolase [Verrucomicrobia bacterium A1]|nr:MAG: NUDIX hydrolase [Verrucomicrobia bacterium A1]
MTMGRVKWDGWVPVQRATLLFVRQRGEILLIEKKRGLGAGKVNAPGGRIEPGETDEAAAVREVEEEVCITPHPPVERGSLKFQFVDGFSISASVFTSDGFTGVPRETDEAVPMWVDERSIPYERMWADDRIWVPHMLAGRRFDGRFLFDGDAMLDYRLEVGPRAVRPAG